MKVFGALRSAMEMKGAEISLRQDSPEMDWFVARATLEQFAEKKDLHDLAHGLNHLASLLAVDPVLPASLELLVGYRAAAGGWLSSILPPQGSQAYFAMEALRANAFADEGQLDEALGLLLQVQRAKNDAAYLETWGADWVERGIDAIEPQQLLYFFGAALMAFPEAKVNVLRREERLRRIVALAVKAAPRMSGPQWDMTFIGLHRKAGLFAEAIRLARVAIELRPAWETFTALGLAFRESGAQREAEAALRKAIEHQPEDLAARLEIADGWFEAGEWKAARAVYGEVLARAANHPWAEPSALFCAWRERSASTFPDEHFPPDLHRLAREGNHRARMLFGRFTPCVGFVPSPNDALASSLRQMIAQNLTPAGTIALSDVEGPSNGVALALYARQKGCAMPGVSYGNIATPDPRMAVEPIAYELFRLDGDQLVPALAPPSDDVSAAIERLATQPFHGEKSWATASRIAASLGPARVRDVLAVMVHPPTPPDANADLVLWVARVQLAAAQVIAHLDDGWEDGVRRAALFSMLLGPRDWVTTAAIVVLAKLAQQHPVLAGDVHAAFTRLDAARPSSGGVTYELALFWHWQSLPTLFPNEREELSKRYSALLDQD